LKQLGYDTVVGCQLSVVGCQLSVVGCQLSVVGWLGKLIAYGRFAKFSKFSKSLKLSKTKNVAVLRLCVFLFFATTSILPAQTEKSKNIEKTFDLSQEGTVKVDHRYGLLKVIQSTDGKVHLNARMRVEGNDEEEIQKALSQFDVDINEFGNQVIIETDLSIKNWNGRNGKIHLTFKNGAKVKGLKKFTVEMLLAVPDLAALTLKNKYEDIIIDHNFKGDLEVEIYDGDLKAKSVDGELELNIKYGKAIFDNIGDADLTLYDSEMEMEAGKAIKLASKYSEYTIGDTESLKINAYDDKFELGNVKGRLEIKDKYSEMEVGNFGEAILEVHDGDFEAKKGGDLSIIDTKYSKYRIAEVGNLEIEGAHDDKFIIKKVANFEVDITKYTEFEIDNLAGKFKVQHSHDDKFVIGTLKDLMVNQSKYTEFEITNLAGQVSLLDSHDDKLDVREVATSFKGLKMNGKYTKVNMDIPSSVKYEIDAEMKYGGIEYDESAFESQYYKEKDSILAVRGKIKGAGPNAPKIEVRGHDCKVDLN